jgi:activator of HSP90 ATPase
LETKKIVGLTKNSGYQISVTKIFNVSYDTMWDFILSEEGINIWLGKSDMIDFELNTPFKTLTGIEGQLKSFKPGVNFKLTWKAADWTNTSKVEIRIDNKNGRARLGILQSFLTSLDQRSSQKKHWDNVIVNVSKELSDIEL